MRKTIATVALAVLGFIISTGIATATPASQITAVEFYDADLDHYFITASPDEIAALNSGRFFGWTPTGQSFTVLSPDATDAGTTPVCRLYGNPAMGLDSHFYSADPEECAGVLSKFSTAWMLESFNVFRGYLPDLSSGVCPAGTKPVYRLWNQRADVNHRYTDKLAIVQTMETRGYVPEGYGTTEPPTAFCEPAADDTAISCTVGALSMTPVVGAIDMLSATCSGNPTSYAWIGCTSQSTTCNAISSNAGGKSYVLTASNPAGTSPPVVVSLVWQQAALTVPSKISCTLAASVQSPIVGTSVTLTATCTGTPTGYTWIGCSSTGTTCTTTSANAGTATYTVTATSAGSSSLRSSIAVAWQPAPAAPPIVAPPTVTPPTTPGPVSCSVAASNLTPLVGGNITLAATCTGNPTSYVWANCPSATSTCLATSVGAGVRTYTVTASNGSSTSTPAAVNVTWQTGSTPPTGLSCAVTTPNAAPVVGTSITLSASCTSIPTSYAWSGCSGSGSTCTATATAAGSQTYSMTANASSGTSAPATVSVTWQASTLAPPSNPPSTPGLSCGLSVSNSAPVIGSSITISSSCSGTTTSYVWTGCTSSSSSCSTTSSTAGLRTYALVASNASASSAASVNVVWLSAPLTGVPISADFIQRSSDPRGGDNAYSTFKRLPNGHGIAFGGFSHNQAGNNAVLDYDPVANVVTVPVANSPWTVAANVSGRSFLGNRDNHSTLVIDGKFWVMKGETGESPVGNYRGILDPGTWKWTYIDDTFTWPQVAGGAIADYENAAYGRIEALDLWYMFGGEIRGNPNDGLIRVERNASGSPYKATEYRDTQGNPSFPGSQKLMYVSQAHWDRGTKLNVYGGTHEDWTLSDSNGVLLRTPGKTLYEIDVQLPSMSVISVNPLPDGQRVEGPAVYGYRDPTRDIAILSDGKKVNVYDYASGAWVNVPINTASDPDRESPSSDGAGRQGFYSPEIGQFVILGGHGKMYTVRMNFGGTSPVAAPSCTATASNTSQVVGTNVTLTATCTGTPTGYSWSGCSSSASTCVTTASAAGTVSYSVTATSAAGSSAPATVSVAWQALTTPVACTLGTSNGTPTVGTGVTLTASCTGNPTSYSWVGCSGTASTCSASSSTAGTQTYSVVASNGSSTSPAAFVSVAWLAVAPPASTGHRTMTTTAVPYTGSAGVLGRGKQYDFARMNGRWYKMAGDHAGIDPQITNDMATQDGRQEILSFNVAANDWREDQPYYVPDSSKIQATNPDDAYVIPRGNEIWYFFSVTTRAVSQQPAGNYATQIQPAANLMAWTPPPAGGPYGTWRVAGQWPSIIGGDRAWRGFYDPTLDRFISPVNKNGAVWAITDGKTGADLTQYTSPGVPQQYGDFIFSVSGCAVDAANGVFYVYDISTGGIYRVSIANPGVPTKVAQLAEPPQSTQAAIKITWDPDIRAVVVAATKISIFEVDSGNITTLDRHDGFVNGAGVYVPTSTIFYDPDTHDIVSIGTMDWDTNINPGVYWRMKIQ